MRSVRGGNDLNIRSAKCRRDLNIGNIPLATQALASGNWHLCTRCIAVKCYAVAVWITPLPADLERNCQVPRGLKRWTGYDTLHRSEGCPCTPEAELRVRLHFLRNVRNDELKRPYLVRSRPTFSRDEGFRRTYLAEFEDRHYSR